MAKKTILVLLVGLALTSVHLAGAQKPKKTYRIGTLNGGSPSTAKANYEAFRERLRQLGYVEGTNVIFEHRYAHGKSDRLPELAAELVRLKVDVILVGGSQTTTAAKQATSTIPIVVGSAGDLVGSGLVASLARPGGNVTGSTAVDADLSGKRLELLREAIPKASRVAVFWHRFRDSTDLEDCQRDRGRIPPVGGESSNRGGTGAD